MNPVTASLALVLAGSALPQVHMASGAQDAGEVDVVTGGMDRHDRLTVPVRVGEQGTFEFLIDTGAQNTVISTALAERLAIKPTAKATLVGVAGREIVDTAEIEEIGLGRRSFYGLTVPLLKDSNMGADGIIGLDSLQQQRVLIDFERKLMLVNDADQLGGNKGFEIVVRARRKSGQLIMTNARVDGVLTDVVIDTGADSSIGNRALQKALFARTHSNTQAVLHSVTGQELIADVMTANRLAIGGMQIANVGIAFADAPPFRVLDLERRPAILLGMRDLRLFKRVAIDFPTRKILFDLPVDEARYPADIGGVRNGRRVF